MSAPDKFPPWWVKVILIVLFLAAATMLARYSNPYSPYPERRRGTPDGR
ncbi:MAG: hypothetical protein V4662_25050 [Verrucomicrobiota bacterium]